MKENTMIATVLGITITVILVATLLYPVIQDAQENEIIRYNNEYPVFASLNEESATIHYTFNPSGQITYSLNGEEKPILSNINNTIVSTSSFILKYVSAGASSSCYLALIDEGQSKRYDDISVVDIALDGQVAHITGTFASSTISFNLPYEWAFVNDTVGDYRGIWSGYNKPIYVHNMGEVFGSGWTSTTNKFFSYGDSIVEYDGNQIDLQYNLVNDSNTINVGSFALNNSGIWFTVDNSGTSYDVTPYLAIVPYEVIGEKTTNSAGISALYGAIPVIVIVAILGLAVATFAYKRDN